MTIIHRMNTLLRLMTAGLAQPLRVMPVVVVPSARQR